jgi:general secretion pathway protein J
MAASTLRRRAAGFTLVEVMVALLIMAILAALAFRGIDALTRAKTAALASTDRTLKLNTGMSQFDYDISQIIDSHVLPRAMMWDGATLRFARRTPEGIQLVLWSLQDRRWQRWASGSFTRTSELTDAWMRSQQWDAISGSAVTVLSDVDTFDFIVCNPGSATGVATTGCSWNNAGSSWGTITPAVTTSGTGTQPTPAAPTFVQPNGIRVTLKLPEGELVRERELPRWGT